MPTKKELYEFCKAFVDTRIARIQNSIQDIQESLTSEIKSSAGDKHETGRAMLQLEREKLGQQLAEAEKMKQVLRKVGLKNNSTTVSLGNLVRTSKSDYYVAISAGEYENIGSPVFCISCETPIGQLLMGKSAGDTFSFKNEEIAIRKIE